LEDGRFSFLFRLYMARRRSARRRGISVWKSGDAGRKRTERMVDPPPRIYAVRDPEL
jgi:hypothetical protein